MSNIIPSRQCGARTKHSGEPCQISLKAGEVRCRLHGGASPQAMAKVRRRLQGLADGAVGILEATIYADAPPCPLCGRGMLTGMHLKAAMTVLDRTGFSPSVNVTHGDGHWEELVEVFTDEEFMTIDAIMEKAQVRLAEKQQEEEPTVTLPSGNVPLLAEVTSQEPDSEPDSEPPASVLPPDPAEEDVEEFGE